MRVIGSLRCGALDLYRRSCPRICTALTTSWHIYVRHIEIDHASRESEPHFGIRTFEASSTESCTSPRSVLKVRQRYIFRRSAQSRLKLADRPQRQAVHHVSLPDNYIHSNSPVCSECNRCCNYQRSGKSDDTTAAYI